jgi:hypothetical protein
MMNKRAFNQQRQFRSVPTRIAAVLLLFGLSMPMQTANSQVTGAQSMGVSAGSPKDNEILAVVSLDIARSFKVDSVKLAIDDDVVSARTFENRDIAAFRPGTVLTHFQGNMPTGEHRLTVFYTGIDGQNRAFKREGSFIVSKRTGPKYVELKISDAQDPDHPTVSMEEW